MCMWVAQENGGNVRTRVLWIRTGTLRKVASAAADSLRQCWHAEQRAVGLELARVEQGLRQLRLGAPSPAATQRAGFLPQGSAAFPLCQGSLVEQGGGESLEVMQGGQAGGEDRERDTEQVGGSPPAAVRRQGMQAPAANSEGMAGEPPAAGRRTRVARQCGASGEAAGGESPEDRGDELTGGEDRGRGVRRAGRQPPAASRERGIRAPSASNEGGAEEILRTRCDR